MISASSSAFASSARAAHALTSRASGTPSGFVGLFGALEIATAGRWRDGFDLLVRAISMTRRSRRRASGRAPAKVS
jgi:hypothetical protein